MAKKTIQDHSNQIPTMKILMQLDTPPCFLTKEGPTGSMGRSACKGCCTCLCPNPPGK